MGKDLVAEFLARGGKISRVAEGVGNGMTNKDWYKAERGLAPRRDDTPIACAVDHLGRTWYKNDEGEVIGHD